MKITLGFSPCPNDTFMFAAMVNGWIDTHGLEFEVHMEDVETLNKMASQSKLDVTKMSFNRALSLESSYRLLSSGAALGNKCGPLVIAKQSLSLPDIVKGPIALPGEWTTAHLLFSIFYPGAANKVFMPFHRIEESVLSGNTKAGVIIHENRFTYEAKGLVKITDLGDDWESKTGLPIPLGGIFAANRVSDLHFKMIESLITESIRFARANAGIVMPYVRQFSQEMNEEVMKQHIDLYVNDFSLDLGEKGLRAAAMLKNMSR